MTLLFENPLPIWAFGAVGLAIAGIVFLAKRSIGSIVGVIGVIAATALLLFVERVVVTPAEQVEKAVESLMTAIESNSLPDVLALIDPSAKNARTDAETLMPQVKVKETGATSVRVEVDPMASPPRATSFFRGKIDAIHARTSARVFFFDQVEIDWQQSGDKWLMVDYRVKFRGKTINPVEGFRTVR